MTQISKNNHTLIELCVVMLYSYIMLEHIQNCPFAVPIKYPEALIISPPSVQKRQLQPEVGDTCRIILRKQLLPIFL